MNYKRQLNIKTYLKETYVPVGINKQLLPVKDMYSFDCDPKWFWGWFEENSTDNDVVVFCQLNIRLKEPPYYQYMVAKLLLQDIHDGSYKYMLKNGLTRI